MKKTIYLLFALLFVLSSCVQELNPIELRSKAEETGMVAVTMELTIPNVEIQALTKATVPIILRSTTSAWQFSVLQASRRLITWRSPWALMPLRMM